MQVILPPEVVEDILIKELSSFFHQLKEKMRTIEEDTYEDFPMYSQDLNEEYRETKRDYEACKRILTYYGGSSCVANII